MMGRTAILSDFHREKQCVNIEKRMNENEVNTVAEWLS